jgi:hypothetical protein
MSGQLWTYGGACQQHAKQLAIIAHFAFCETLQPPLKHAEDAWVSR